jgi:hypothetical protein
MHAGRVVRYDRRSDVDVTSYSTTYREALLAGE